MTRMCYLGLAPFTSVYLFSSFALSISVFPLSPLSLLSLSHCISLSVRLPLSLISLAVSLLLVATSFALYLPHFYRGGIYVALSSIENFPRKYANRLYYCFHFG